MKQLLKVALIKGSSGDWKYYTPRCFNALHSDVRSFSLFKIMDLKLGVALHTRKHSMLGQEECVMLPSAENRPLHPTPQKIVDFRLFLMLVPFNLIGTALISRFS